MTTMIQDNGVTIHEVGEDLQVYPCTSGYVVLDQKDDELTAGEVALIRVFTPKEAEELADALRLAAIEARFHDEPVLIDMASRIHNYGVRS